MMLEPRLLSNYSQDENMINAYKEGKDLYSMIASKVYHNKYEDNLEHYPDGSIYEDGKKRRTSVKGLLLGIMYGMGVQSIANTINGTYKEAQDILDGFFKSFPKVKSWIDTTESFGQKYGYVEDWYGRRRRLPDLLLEPYEIKRIASKDSNVPSNFNPFIGCSFKVQKDEMIEKYAKLCNGLKSYKDYDDLKKRAYYDGIEIRSNTSLIASAKRQCVNARIQGGAATMTKVAMIKLYNDKELRDLDFHMLIGVHDELIGECPKENAEKVADRLTYIMKTCIQDYCVVPFKCDADITEHWYESEYNSSVKKEYKELIKKGMTEDVAYKTICENHSESTQEYLDKLFEKC